MKRLPKRTLLAFFTLILALTFPALLPSPAFSFVTVGPTGDYLTIEAGLIAATLEADKTCSLEAGVFTGPDNGYNIDWPNCDGLTLRGAGSNETIISAEALGRVIKVANAISLTIESLTIRDGKTTLEGGGGIMTKDYSILNLKNINMLRNIATREVFTATAVGGAIYSPYSAQVTAEGCSFIDNSAFDTAGVAYQGDWNVRNCSFINNSTYSNGGVAYFSDWNAVNCTFKGNSASKGQEGCGGVVSHGYWNVENCVFSDNIALNFGGVIHTSFITADSCWFINNSTLGGDYSEGGVAYLDSGFFNAINCIFFKNHADYGGVVETNALPWTATNCAFAYNYAGTEGGVAYYSSKWKAFNCIFWGNTAPTGEVFSFMSPSLYYSDLQPNGWIVGYSGTITSQDCLSSNPLFRSTDEASSDFLLLGPGSKCIDKGTPLGAYHGFSRDMGIYEFQGPSISIESPSGGDILTAGSSTQLNWIISGEVVGNVTVRLSTNEGNTWDTLITTELAAPGRRTLSWIVPNLISTECLLSIEATGNGIWNYITSSATFEINIPTPGIWVSTTGSDLNDGKFGSPVQTVTRGLSLAGTGETVYVFGGTYSGAGNYNIPWPNRNNVTLKASMETTPATIDAGGVAGRRVIVVESLTNVTNLTIEGITLQKGIDNDANGAGLFLNTGGINVWLKNVTIQDCTSEGHAGGAVGCLNYTVKVFAQNCIFNRNYANMGGAIRTGTWTLSNCKFINNWAWRGGVAYDVLFYANNCIFINNNASDYGGIIYNSAQGAITATNCIFWANSSPNYPLFYGIESGSLRFCDIQGGWTGTGNISSEPMFVSTAEGAQDFHLKADSPCIDSGTKEAGLPAADADGYPRPHGAGVDIGVYEFRGPSITVLSPNGGETLPGESNITITWRTSDEGGLRVSPKPITIRCSINAGLSWSLITQEVDDTGIYTWEAPQIQTKNALISIEAVNLSGVWNYDTSNAAFEIASPVYVSKTGSDDSGDGTPGNPYRTITKGLSMVSTGQKVCVFGGTYNEYNIPWPNRNNITLKASMETTPVTIDAGNVAGQRCIMVGFTVNLTLEGITLQKGRLSGSGTSNYGAAINLAQSNIKLWLNNVTIRDCTVEGSSACTGVYSANDTDMIFARNCLFTNNINQPGTGAGVGYNGTWTVFNSKFINNKVLGANTWSGGSVAYLGSWKVTDCTFEGNSGYYGGVAYTSTWTVSNCTFSNNSAQSGGVASASNWTVDNCIFKNNTASFVGAVSWGSNAAKWNVTNSIFDGNNGAHGMDYQSSWNAANCTFMNNNMTGDSGVFHTSKVFATSCAFTNNRANRGGVFLFCPTITVESCTFNGNSDVVGGGVDYQSAWFAANCTFEGNSAPDYGGVFYGSALINMINCNFRNNLSKYGSVAYTGTGKLMGCVFTANSATLDGGVAYNSTWTVSNCAFEGNSAKRYGGVAGLGKWNVTDSVFRNNIASSPDAAMGNGGVIYNISAANTWVVTNCAFTGNRAYNTGGVADTAYMNAFNCTFTSNETIASGSKGGVGSASIIEATNCIFKNNKAVYGGVGQGGTWIVMNCAIYKNTANTNGSVAGGQTTGTGGTWNAVNTIFWANSGTLFYNTPAGGTLKCCDVQDNLWGNLTPTRPISAEPRFISTAEGAEDFHLKSSSPCIDSGTLEGATKDKDNYNRPLPAGGKKDIGPYEYGGGVIPPLPVVRNAATGYKYYSINQALNDASAGDTIILAAGTYTDIAIIWPSTNNLILSGEGVGIVTLEGNGTESIISIGSITATVEGITFMGGGGTQAGAISVEGGAVEVRNCVFVDNGASSAGSSLMIKNCLWIRGHGISDSGAVHGDEHANISIINSTFYGNSAEAGGAALYIESGGHLNVLNSILWNNTPYQIAGGGTVTVNCSDIQGGWSGGTGNISAEPRFVSTSESNFRLQGNSPCIDMATAVGAPAKDLDGISRPQPAPPTYQGGIPDMGAYEYHTGTPIIDQVTGKAYYNLAVAFSNITQPTVISLPAGDYSDVVIVWPDIENITLEGQGSQETVLTGVGPGPIIYVGNVTATIQNIGFVGAGGTQQSAIIFDGTTGVVENCKFVHIRSEIASFITYRNDLLVDCGLMTKGSDATIWAVNSTFYNTAISIDAGSVMKVVNCILWNSSPTVPISGEGTVTVEYSDVQGGWTGTGNINVDPLFVNTAVVPDGFQLQPTSECIDSGTSEGAPLYDFNSVPRPQPPGGKFDIGCFEWAEFPKITVEVNGERFLSGDLLAPSKVNTVRINATSGVPIVIVGMFLDGVPVTGITGSAPWWSGTFTSPAQGGHHLTFFASNEASRTTIVTMEARISGGAVKMIGNPLNYPNPFKPMSGQSTRIQYTLTADAPVTLIIYDITGHEVKRFNFSAGENGGRANINSVFWDGKSLFGQYSGNAMYIYKVIHKDRVLGTGKLVILD